MIKKYKISVPKSTLNNIYKKVRNYPWNNIQKMDGWLHGTNHDYLKNISKYWTSKFNWKLQEKKINKLNKKIHRAEEQCDENKVWWRKIKLGKLKEKIEIGLSNSVASYLAPHTSQLSPY